MDQLALVEYKTPETAPNSWDVKADLNAAGLGLFSVMSFENKIEVDIMRRNVPLITAILHEKYGATITKISR